MRVRWARGRAAQSCGQGCVLKGEVVGMWAGGMGEGVGVNVEGRGEGVLVSMGGRGKGREGDGDEP